MLKYTRKGGALRDSGQEADDGRRHQAAVSSLNSDNDIVKTMLGEGEKIEISDSYASNEEEKSYLNNHIGLILFSNIIYGEKIQNTSESGASDWYSYCADVDGITLEVDSYGKNGKPLIVSAMDLMETGNTDIFMKIIKCVFFGDTQEEVLTWVQQNLGTETSLKIGCTNIVLRLTVMGYPVLYILDDEYLNYI